ncbi:hypothetical protein PG985_013591 [Apiospora marii]|uniref:uncharacterized protein n=1 Tax=Apiospora marii TaxID=335849 RepID=UPI0031304005
MTKLTTTLDCDEVYDGTWWDASPDVSGGKKGIRVVGPAEDPDIFEANVLAVHWKNVSRTNEYSSRTAAYYKARGQKIYDLGGKEHGFCRPINSQWRDCHYEYHSIFHCNSDYIASQMSEAGYQTGPP